MSSVNPLLLPVKKDIDTIHHTVITNIIEMLGERKWIKKDNIKSVVSGLIDTHNDESEYKIALDIDLNEFASYDPTDSKEKKLSNGNFVVLKLVPYKITGLNKAPNIIEFMNTHKDLHKILVVDSIQDKTKQQIISSGKIEVFREVFFLQKLTDMVCSPQYELLNPSECQLILDEYGLTRKQMKKILDSDPGAFYYYGKVKQILRIIRNNELTGQSIDYRIIIHKG
jgi:DNA-directed RNA polymerase subunit H (RpoH/RPB5)